MLHVQFARFNPNYLHVVNFICSSRRNVRQKILIKFWREEYYFSNYYFLKEYFFVLDISSLFLSANQLFFVIIFPS